jgi:hypothetical protein
MLESNSALVLLRSCLKGETNPHLQLILLEQGMIFCNLPPDLEALRSELSERLAPFPIPPVVDVKSWVKRSSGQNLTTPDSPSAQPPKALP